MENSPPAASSLEKQIDNFLEHFKRSASKAMEAEWCSMGGSSNNVTGSTTNSTVINNSAAAAGTENFPTQTQMGAATTGTVAASTVLQTSKQMSFEKHQHHFLQRTRSRSSCLELNNMMMGKQKILFV